MLGTSVVELGQALCLLLSTTTHAAPPLPCPRSCAFIVHSPQKPKLHYFGIAGRGETARLICAAGELEFEDDAWVPAFEDGVWRQGYQEIGKSYGFPGTMPILVHGDLKLFQHNAVESYLASIAPKFAFLTPAQKATDLMICITKADILGNCESLLFKKIDGEQLLAALDKQFPLLEGLLPETGFVNGLGFPTCADCAVLVVAKGCMPFQAAMKLAGFDWVGKFPKIERIAAETAAYPPVAKFLETSANKTLTADPLGIMG